MKNRAKNRNRNKKWKIIFLPILTVFLISFLYYFSQIYTEKWNFKWVEISPEIRDSILKLDEYGTITGSAVGYYGKTPQQWHRQNWILKHATIAELEKLTEYPSGTVKGIAYEGLLRKSTTNKYNLFKKSLNDTLTFVFYQSGCEGNRFMLSEYLSFISDLEVPQNEYGISLNLSDLERNKILAELKAKREKKEFYKTEFYKRIK